ncbi:MAG TPA: HPr family phosphocarrier protein [Anaeromyxobacteraceae bacterium]|jgi:phosphocarrier protein|nr:HPr family phosphocarrier protein [Anaeromyxobacteraceae bacterium]
MQRLEKTFVVVNALGLHARPAALVVQTANRFRSDVQFEKDGLQINAKSIMGVLTLAAGRGTAVLVACEGEDAADALAAIGKLFETGFGER